MNERISPFRERLLAFILGYYQDNGYSPTYKEMSEATKEGRMKMSSGSILFHVNRLIQEGKLKRSKKTNWRNIVPIDAKD